MQWKPSPPTLRKKWRFKPQAIVWPFGLQRDQALRLFLKPCLSILRLLFIQWALVSTPKWFLQWRVCKSISRDCFTEIIVWGSPRRASQRTLASWGQTLRKWFLLTMRCEIPSSIPKTVSLSLAFKGAWVIAGCRWSLLSFWSSLNATIFGLSHENSTSFCLDMIFRQRGAWKEWNCPRKLSRKLRIQEWHGD